MPGDDLIVSIWVDADTTRFQTRNQDGDIVFDQGLLRTG